ncbi:MAG: class E sortase [Microthrixaceae bacterium]|nr:class E sortase [Microthrixaceae bacterium]
MFARFLSGLGKTMIAMGVITFLFVAFQLWGTELEESQAQGDLTDELSRSLTTIPGAPEDAEAPADDAEPQTLDEITASLGEIDPADAKSLPKPEIGESLGVIQFKPNLNQAGIDMRKVFVEGTDKEDLKAGPGHYLGAPFPGQKGNASIAGHRVTYGAPFHRMDELVPGDLISVFTRQGDFTYRVLPPPADFTGEKGPAHWVVAPSDVSVLDDFGDNRLTLTGCHPKYSAAKRIIVAAELVGNPAETTDGNEAATEEVAGEDQEVAAGPDDTIDDLGWSSEYFPNALAWSGAAFGVWLLAFVIGLGVQSKKWIVYLVALPPFLYCLWFAFTWINRWIPSL